MLLALASCTKGHPYRAIGQSRRPVINHGKRHPCLGSRAKAAVTVDSIIPPITLPRFHWALNRRREEEHYTRSITSTIFRAKPPANFLIHSKSSSTIFPGFILPAEAPGQECFPPVNILSFITDYALGLARPYTVAMQSQIYAPSQIGRMQSMQIAALTRSLEPRVSVPVHPLLRASPSRIPALSLSHYTAASAQHKKPGASSDFPFSFLSSPASLQPP